MKVTESVLEQAIFQIFLDLNVYSGGRLALASLEQAWPQSHLRHNDLYAGIGRLVAQDLLRREVEPEGVFIVLTERGFERASIVPVRWRSLLGLARNWTLSEMARHRNASISTAQRNRRETDPRPFSAA